MTMPRRPRAPLGTKAGTREARVRQLSEVTTDCHGLSTSVATGLLSLRHGSVVSDALGNHPVPMRAVVKAAPGRGCQFVVDRQEADLRAGQVRVEVAAASVCGSDAAFYESGFAAADIDMTFPRTMGHEVGGIVVEVGADAGGLSVGMPVALETHLHCGQCFNCMAGDAHNCARMELLGVTVDGAFAERLVIPSRSCFVLPDGINPGVAALLESAGSALHGVLRSGVNRAGASVLI